MAEPNTEPTAPMTCDTFQQWLRDRALAPQNALVWSSATQEHLAGCAHCRAQIGLLWAALAETAEDALTCDACEDQLPAYLAAQSQDDDTAWHPIQRHLRGCPACLALYAELRQLVQQATHTEQFVVLPAPPAPDLVFLAAPPRRQPARQTLTSPQSVPVPTWWWIDEAGQLLIEFSAQLLAALTPPPLVGIKGAGGERLLYHLTLADAVADLEVAISVQATTADRCALWVDVNLPGTGGWPHLAGSTVTLWRAMEWLDQQATDAYGKVVFTGIDRADLVVLRVAVAPTPR